MSTSTEIFAAAPSLETQPQPGFVPPTQLEESKLQESPVAIPVVNVTKKDTFKTDVVVVEETKGELEGKRKVIRPVHVLPLDVNEKHKKGTFGDKWKRICEVFFLFFLRYCDVFSNCFCFGV